MSASELCKKSLVTLESYLKDEHINSETLKFAAISVLLIDGKKPNPLEEVEILDTIATYMMLKNEEDVKYRLFFEVFPADKDISAESLYFLVKLSSLAICLGLSPLLEIVSLWLKDHPFTIFLCYKKH
uniref:SJCHGC02471 protein n=1 Tax=Schistosoma japonicum TaxID=6182 RepID=Q5DCY6_SCHJA|nr:SJCHGC02471 protein [Schistosoma japonicum]